MNNIIQGIEDVLEQKNTREPVAVKRTVLRDQRDPYPSFLVESASTAIASME